MANDEPTFEVISRKDAKAKGLRFYYTGKPCKHGHLGPRRVCETGCATCSRIKLQKWRSENREKSREIDSAWKAKNRERLNVQGRARYAKNPTKHIAKVKKYYEKNGEEVRRKRIAYHYRTYTKDDVRKKAQERTKKWAIINPERCKVNSQISRIRRKNLDVEGSHTPEDIKRILKQQKRRCAYCKTKLGEKYHVDHITPLSKGGTNFAKNLQITCARCNLEKYARDPIVHARMLGMLL